MPELIKGAYDRNAAVTYAHTWAYERNPSYYNFDGIGGDCTNFASQCVFAGAGIMNYTPTYGWYYVDINRRAPAWSSVIYFYNFLTGNRGEGPYGKEVRLDEVQEGDLAQLVIDEQDYQHTPFIVSVGRRPSPDNILVAAHTFDCDNRPLSSYNVKGMRFIHIDGFRCKQ